jgi:hypothetical protein
MGEGATTVVCRIQYSGRAPALIAALAAATCALIAITPAPSVARTLGAAWTAAAAAAAARRVSPGRRGSGPRALVVRSTGEVAVMEAAGRWTHGELRDGSFVAPWLVIVRWRPEGARWDRTTLILPGMAAPEARRRLRVLLRWR